MKTNNFKIGDIVVWSGNEPCIGKIQKKCSFDSRCWYISDSHNSCYFKFLRLANTNEIKKLGNKQIILL